MKTFVASEELVFIFLKNGFSDLTEKFYPKHFEMIAQTGYEPNIIKRKFSMGSTRDYILLDYINIIPVRSNGWDGKESRITIMENELRSIITYYKLSTQEKAKCRKLIKFLPDLHLYIDKINENRFRKTTSFDKKIKLIFEAIELN